MAAFHIRCLACSKGLVLLVHPSYLLHFPIKLSIIDSEGAFFIHFCAVQGCSMRALQSWPMRFKASIAEFSDGYALLVLRARTSRYGSVWVTRASFPGASACHQATQSLATLSCSSGHSAAACAYRAVAWRILTLQ